MRIEAYSQVQQLYQSKKIMKNQPTGTVNRTDQLQISSFGRDIQTAKAALASTPDIRQDIIAPIKNQIDNGTYKVDTADFADKLLQKFEETR